MKKVELKGIITPILTPMKEDESINTEELRNQIERLIDGGVHGIFPFGTNGEGYILSEAEKVEVLETTIDQVKGRVPVYAGSGCISTADTIRMSKKAEELGLTSTHFENPNGLPQTQADGTSKDVNYSTAYELAIIAREAFKNEWVQETMQLKEADVVLPGDTRIKIENRNTELGSNGNIGGKTGVTDSAGTCFAGVYERDGRKLVGVVLKCDRNNNNKRFEDLKSMMDYSYPLEKEVFKASGDEVGTMDLEYKLFGFFGPTKKVSTKINLAQDVKLYKNAINDTAEIKLNNTEKQSAWKVASNKEVNLTVSVKAYSESVKGNVDITVGTLIKANILIYGAIILAFIVIIALIIFIIKLISDSSRKHKRRY